MTQTPPTNCPEEWGLTQTITGRDSTEAEKLGRPVKGDYSNPSKRGMAWTQVMKPLEGVVSGERMSDVLKPEPTRFSV